MWVDKEVISQLLSLGFTSKIDLDWNRLWLPDFVSLGLIGVSAVQFFNSPGVYEGTQVVGMLNSFLGKPLTLPPEITSWNGTFLDEKTSATLRQALGHTLLSSFLRANAQVWVDYAGMRLFHPSVNLELVPKESNITAFFDSGFCLEAIFNGWSRYGGETGSWSFHLRKVQGLGDVRELLDPYAFRWEETGVSRCLKGETRPLEDFPSRDLDRYVSEIREDIQTGMSATLLHGKTGAGKTSLAHKVAELFGTEDDFLICTAAPGCIADIGRQIEMLENCYRGIIIIIDEIDKVRDLDDYVLLRAIDRANLQFFKPYHSKPIILIGTVNSLNLPEQLTRKGRFGRIYEVESDQESGKVVSIKLHQPEDKG